MSKQEEDQRQETDISTLQQELEALKTSYSELEGKYNQLDNTHNEYKFDTEFQKDIRGISNSISDSELNVLKQLKQKGDIEAYNLLKSKYSENITTYRDSNGNSVKYTPQGGSSDNVGCNGNLFEYECSKIKEEK